MREFILFAALFSLSTSVPLRGKPSFMYRNANVSSPSLTFKVCGSYCGPGWCDNQYLDEDSCDTSAEPQNCEDRCCRDHDHCCGFGARSTCNDGIVDCLMKCDIPTLFDLTGCHSWPVAPAMTLFMAAIGGRCCGDVCPDGPNYIPAIYVPESPRGYNFVPPQGRMKGYCAGGAEDYPAPVIKPTCPDQYNLVRPQGRTMKAHMHP